MKVRLGKGPDYSLRAVLYLARNTDGYHSSPRIAEAMDIPANWLPQLLSSLVTAGVIESTAGRHGGYRLAQPSGAISVWDVIEAVEPMGDTECVLRGGECSWEHQCTFHETWFEARQALSARLTATTFADLAASDLPPMDTSSDASRPDDAHAEPQ